MLCKAGSPCRLWRNNSGCLPDGKGGFVRYGLGIGSADLVGLIVGVGRLLAVEIKTPTGRMSEEQLAWHTTVRGYGGIAVVIRTVEEAEDLLRRILDGSI